MGVANTYILDIFFRTKGLIVAIPSAAIIYCSWPTAWKPLTHNGVRSLPEASPCPGRDQGQLTCFSNDLAALCPWGLKQNVNCASRAPVRPSTVGTGENVHMTSAVIVLSSARWWALGDACACFASTLPTSHTQVSISTLLCTQCWHWQRHWVAITQQQQHKHIYSYTVSYTHKQTHTHTHTPHSVMHTNTHKHKHNSNIPLS